MKLADICSLVCIVLYVRSASNQDVQMQPVTEVATNVANYECTICGEDDSEKSYTGLICGHAYCISCLFSWIKVHNNSICPTCRAVVALSRQDVGELESVGLKLPDEVLGDIQEKYDKFFVSVPSDIELHAFGAFLRFCLDVVREETRGHPIDHDIFTKTYLYQLLQLADAYNLNGLVQDKFNTNFNRSLSTLSPSDIQSFLVKKTERENLIKLLTPVFGDIGDASPEETSFTYSNQNIKLYTALGLLDTSILKSLSIEDCTVSSNTVSDIVMLLNAPNLQDLSFSHVDFQARITGIGLNKLRSLSLHNVHGTDQEAFAENSLKELLSVSKELVGFSVSQLIPGQPDHLAQLCLKQIADLGYQLETLKVENYFTSHHHLALFETIFKNSKLTLREISFVDHEMRDITGDELDNFFNSLSALELLTTLEASRIGFGNREVRAKFCHSLKSFKKLTKLTLNVAEFDSYNGNAPKDIHKLPASLKELKSLEILSLSLKIPSDMEVVSSIRSILESVQTGNIKLDITVQMPSKYNEGVNALIKETFQMLAAQRTLRNLTVKSMFGVPGAAAKIVFDEINEMVLDSLSICEHIRGMNLCNGVKNVLRSDAKISTLKFVSWKPNSFFLSTEIGEKLATMNALTCMSVSTFTSDLPNMPYLNFLEGLSKSTSVRKLHVSSTNYDEWSDEMYNAIRKFKNLEAIVLSECKDKKKFDNFKAKVASHLRDTAIQISVSPGV